MKIFCTIGGSASLSIQIGHSKEKDFIIFQTKKVFAEQKCSRLFIRQNKGTVQFPLATKKCPNGNIVIIYAKPVDIISAIKLILSPDIFPHLAWEADLSKTQFQTTLMAYLSNIQALLFHETALNDIREMIEKTTCTFQGEDILSKTLDHIHLLLQAMCTKKLISSDDYLQLYRDVNQTIEGWEKGPGLVKDTNTWWNEKERCLYYTSRLFFPPREFAVTPYVFRVIREKFEPFLRSKTAEEVFSATDIPEEICEMVSSYAV